MIELLDDHSKATACHMEEAEAFFQSFRLGRGVSGVDRVVPDFPACDSEHGIIRRMIQTIWFLPLNYRPQLTWVHEIVERAHFDKRPVPRKGTQSK